MVGFEMLAEAQRDLTAEQVWILNPASIVCSLCARKTEQRLLENATSTGTLLISSVCVGIS